MGGLSSSLRGRESATRESAAESEDAATAPHVPPALPPQPEFNW